MKVFTAFLTIAVSAAFADTTKLDMSPGSSQAIEVGGQRFEISCQKDVATTSACIVQKAVKGDCYGQGDHWHLLLDKKLLIECGLPYKIVETLKMLKLTGQCGA